MPDKIISPNARILARRRSMASSAPSSRERREASLAATYRFLVGISTESGFIGSSLLHR
jgi:hypothetical protein